MAIDNNKPQGSSERKTKNLTPSEIVERSFAESIPLQNLVDAKIQDISPDDAANIRSQELKSRSHVDYRSKREDLYRLECEHKEKEEEIRGLEGQRRIAEGELKKIEDKIWHVRGDIERIAAKITHHPEKEGEVVGWKDIKQVLGLKRSAINKILKDAAIVLPRTNEPQPRPKFSFTNIGKFFVHKNLKK